MTGVGWG